MSDAGPTSWDAMAWAYKLDLSQAIPPRNEPRAKAVLAALCFHCSEQNGDVVWPGAARLAEMTGYSPRTVGKALDELEGVGLIRRTRQHRENGARTVDRTAILFDLDEFSSLRRLYLGEATSPSSDGLGEVSAPTKAKSLHDLGEVASEEPQGEPQVGTVLSRHEKEEKGSGEATSPRTVSAVSSPRRSRQRKPREVRL